MRAWNVTQLPRACRTRAGGSNGRRGGGREEVEAGQGERVEHQQTQSQLWPLALCTWRPSAASPVGGSVLSALADVKVPRRRPAAHAPSLRVTSPPLHRLIPPLLQTPTTTLNKHTHPGLPLCRCLDRFTHFVGQKRWGKDRTTVLFAVTSWITCNVGTFLDVGISYEIFVKNKFCAGRVVCLFSRALWHLVNIRLQLAEVRVWLPATKWRRPRQKWNLFIFVGS